jgi:ATP-dependent DNA ligase
VPAAASEKDPPAVGRFFMSPDGVDCRRRHPPTGALWLETKHDGFHVVARKDGDRVRLYSRPGNDLTYRFPLIVEAVARLQARSCIVDGEAVCCGDDRVRSFDRIRYRRHEAGVFLYAFDLIELDDDDLRRAPLDVRKATPSGRSRPACGSPSTLRPTARPCSRTPARWAWRASCRSARPRPTAPADRPTASR